MKADNPNRDKWDLAVSISEQQRALFKAWDDFKFRPELLREDGDERHEIVRLVSYQEHDDQEVVVVLRRGWKASVPGKVLEDYVCIARYQTGVEEDFSRGEHLVSMLNVPVRCLGKLMAALNKVEALCES